MRSTCVSRVRAFSLDISTGDVNVYANCKSCRPTRRGPVCGHCLTFEVLSVLFPRTFTMQFIFSHLLNMATKRCFFEPKPSAPIARKAAVEMPRRTWCPWPTLDAPTLSEQILEIRSLMLVTLPIGACNFKQSRIETRLVQCLSFCYGAESGVNFALGLV